MMFWDDDNDSEDTQRFKNFALFKFWGTNKERDEFFSSPWLLVLILVAIGILVTIAFALK